MDYSSYLHEDEDEQQVLYENMLPHDTHKARQRPPSYNRQTELISIIYLIISRRIIP